jgi:hypothetical protein
MAKQKIKRDNELRTYEDIVDFVTVLPGSNPPGGMMPNSLGGGKDPSFVSRRDRDMEKALSGEAALVIFQKYHMSVSDRKRMIEAILNVKEPI